MERDLKALEANRFDVVIIGGGMFGVAIAWDAALRGLRAALIERGDFCQETSAHSFRMVHGGIRYVQHLDIVRIRESVRERRALLRIAPHLVEPLPIAIPTFGRGMKSREALMAGMRLYELLGCDRNRGIRDSARRIPRARFLSRVEALQMFPLLEGSRLTGAGVFWDGQIYNPPRLALSFVSSAVAKGAIAANYVEADRLRVEGDQVVGIEATDRLTGSRFYIRGQVIVNATGAWASPLLARAAALRLRPGVVFSRDACFITKRPPIGNHALAILGTTRDPDALLSREARHLFLAPWRGHLMAGVWHQVFQGDPDAVAVTEDEVQSWLDELNASCPLLRLRLDEVACYNAGLTLFGDNVPGARDLSYGHRSRLVDHAETDRLHGLLTVIGVRLTVARGLAEAALNMVGRQLGRRLPACRTEQTPLDGGDLDDVEGYAAQVVSPGTGVLPSDLIYSLVRNYGSAHTRILEYVRREPRLGQRMGTSGVIGAQVVHAVRKEMAQRLVDVVYRRTDLGTFEIPEAAAVRDAAAIMAEESGWTAARVAEEVGQVHARFPRPIHQGAGTSLALENPPFRPV